MRKIIIPILLIFPCFILAQTGNDNIPLDTTNTIVLKAGDPIDCSVYITSIGDTIVNLNSLNNGIIKYQISKESLKIITFNGLEVKDGGIVIVKSDSLLQKDFSFDVKTFASDQEWYENTIKVKLLNPGTIKLINVSSDKIEMATGFRKEGKIYVVISVSMILFFTITFYLIYLERKVKKLEKILKK